MQQANNMNVAISAATGLNRAHITYGGYHDAL